MGGFSSPTTRGDPNEFSWATSDFERRHSVAGTTTWLVKPWLDITSVVRLTSGAPFTPRVGSDINGDGSRNDRAFVFNPADPAIATDTARIGSILGAIRCGLLKGLFTDDRTARELVRGLEARPV